MPLVYFVDALSSYFEYQMLKTGIAEASWEVQLIVAYQQDALNLDSQTEILLWDSSVGDGIDDEDFE